MDDMVNLSATLKSNSSLTTSVNNWVKNLCAGTVLADTIATKTINLKTSGVIKSNNYVTGKTGFKISYNGNAEFNNGTFNGIINATSGTFAGIIEQNGLKNFMLGYMNLYYINNKVEFDSNFCDKVVRMDSGRYLCLFKELPNGITYDNYYSVVLNQIGGSDVGYTNEDALFNDNFSTSSSKNRLYTNPLYRVNIRAMDYKCRSYSRQNGKIISAPIRYMINSHVYKEIGDKHYYVPYATFNKISTMDREIFEFYYGAIDSAYKYSFVIGITDYNTDSWEDPVGGVSMTVTLQQQEPVT